MVDSAFNSQFEEMQKQSSDGYFLSQTFLK